MISESELLVMGFLALGGVIMFLPIVLLGKLSIVGLLKGIGIFVAIVLSSTLFYLVVTDASVFEILTLKANSSFLPKRIFSVSYTMIIIFLVILPIALLRSKIRGKGEKMGSE